MAATYNPTQWNYVRWTMAYAQTYLSLTVLMGLLLAIILLFNMLGALLIIPSFIAVFKPKFIVGEK